MIPLKGRAIATSLTRDVGWRTVLFCTAATLLSACTSIAPVSLPLPGRNDTSAADTQARVAATTVAAAQQAQAAALAQATVAATQQPTPLPTVASGPQPQLISVRRGAIDEIAQFDGRISSADQVPLAFSATGTVASVAVSPGQSVNAGDDLLVTDPAQIQQSITDTQQRIDTANARAQLAQAQLNARQQDAQKAALDAVQHAQDNLSKVQAGSTQSEKQAADAGVLNAQAALDKIQADLDKLRAPATPAQIQAADGKVADAQLRLRDAQAAKAKLLAGPDPATLQAAQRDLLNAQDAQTQAQADLDALTSGPDPYALRAAQREVDKAQAGITVAQNMHVSNTTGVTSDQRDMAIKTAQFALQDAQDKLAQLKQPPKPAALDAATAKVEATKRAVANIQDKLSTLQQPPDQLSIDNADGAISDAQLALDDARQAQAALHAAPASDQLTAAQNALQGAQLALQAAQTRRDDVYGHPTDAELQPAQQQLADAQAQLAKTRDTAKTDPSTGDVMTQQSDIAQMRQQLATLRAALDATHLRAPFDGTIVSILAHAGDGVTAGKPVVTMAHSGDPIVTITLPVIAASNDGSGGATNPANRIAAGQPAKVQIDGGDGTILNGSVASVNVAADGNGRVGEIQVTWGDHPPTLGGTALVKVAVRHKDDALLVPASAVHALGSRKTVDILSGTQRKSIIVDTGILADQDLEIVNGLTEGQQILSGLTVDSGPSTSPAQTDGTLDTGPTITSAESPTAASATPVPAATPVTVATPSPVATPAPVLLFDENFSDNRQSWLDSVTTGAWLQPDGYHLEPRMAGQFLAVGAPISTVPADVQVSATLQKSGGPSGGGYGLIVRDQEPSGGAHAQTGAFYVLEVGDRGDVGIWRREGDHWVELLPWTPATAVHADGAANQLTVRAVGDQLTFLVNGQVVATRQDATLAVGRVGLFVGGDGNQVIAQRFTVQSL